MKAYILRRFRSLVLALICMTTSAAAYSAPMPTSFSDIVSPLMPAVVNISTVQKVSVSAPGGPFPPGSPFENFNRFFEHFGMPPGLDFDDTPQDRKAVSLGSGFIIDPTGYIVTNYHVIENADEITVNLSHNGAPDKQYTAKVVGSDQKTDLALLKITADTTLPFVEFGDSNKVKVGDWVIAIGNPFNLGGTVTVGIVSALARNINNGGIVDFIQTDAAINQGNSGGPMFNIEGKVIGVNTAILSVAAGGNIGIGFATPSDIAKDVISQLREHGSIERGLLGVRMQPVTKEFAQSLGIEEGKGVIVHMVEENSAASKAGILAGDVILSYNGSPIDQKNNLSRMVANTKPGTKVKVEVLREGKKKVIEVTIGTYKEDSLASVTESGDNLILGMKLSPLTKEQKSSLHLKNNISGLMVDEIATRSSSYRRGLRRGDAILSANQQPLENVKTLKEVIEQAKYKRRDSILLLIYRSGGTLLVTVPIDSGNK